MLRGILLHSPHTLQPKGCVAPQIAGSAPVLYYAVTLHELMSILVASYLQIIISNAPPMQFVF